MSEWHDVYRRFNRLEREWSVHEHPGVNRQLFEFATRTPREDSEVDREFASFGAAPPGVHRQRSDPPPRGARGHRPGALHR